MHTRAHLKRRMKCLRQEMDPQLQVMYLLGDNIPLKQVGLIL